MQELDRSSFLRCCREVAAKTRERSSIGLLSEKQLHSALKRWMAPDLSCHEQRVYATDGSGAFVVADALLPDGEAIEVQTGSLYPLARKLHFYFERTDCRVTLLHPLAGTKRLAWIDPASGEIGTPRRSPKHQTPLSGLGDLKPLLPFLGDPRLKVLFPVLEMEEYRFLDGWDHRRKRGSHRMELFATDLTSLTVLCNKEDYRALLPPQLPAEFTAKELSGIARLGSGYGLYHVLAVLCAMGVLEKGEKRGRSYLYRRL